MGITAIRKESKIEKDLEALNVKFINVIGKAKSSEDTALIKKVKKMTGNKKGVLFINRNRMYGTEAEYLSSVDCVVIVEDVKESKVAGASALLTKVIELLGGAKVTMTAYSNGKMCLVAMREKAEEGNE